MAKAAIFRQKFLSHRIRRVEKPQFTMMWSISFQAIFDQKVQKMAKKAKKWQKRPFLGKNFCAIGFAASKNPNFTII